MTFPFLLPRNTSLFHNEKVKKCFSRIRIANARITILNSNFKKIKFWLKFLCRWDLIKIIETKYIMIIFIIIVFKTKYNVKIFSLIIRKKQKIALTYRKNALKHRNDYQICYKFFSHLTYNWIVIVNYCLNYSRFYT